MVMLKEEKSITFLNFPQMLIFFESTDATNLGEVDLRELTFGGFVTGSEKCILRYNSRKIKNKTNGSRWCAGNVHCIRSRTLSFYVLE